MVHFVCMLMCAIPMTSQYNKGPANIAKALATTLAPLDETVLPITYEQVELHAANSSFRRRLSTGSRSGTAPSLVKIVKDLEKHVVVAWPYALQSLEDMYQLANLIDNTGLTLRDKYIFSSAPVSGNNIYAQSALVYFANKLVAEGEVVLRPEDFAVPEASKIQSAKKLSLVEEMYSIVDTYRWLSVRFPDEFPSGALTVMLAGTRLARHVCAVCRCAGVHACMCAHIFAIRFRIVFIRAHTSATRPSIGIH